MLARFVARVLRFLPFSSVYPIPCCYTTPTSASPLVFVPFLLASISIIRSSSQLSWLAGDGNAHHTACALGIVATELRVFIQVHENIQCTGESRSLLASFPKHFGKPSLGYTVSIFYLSTQNFCPVPRTHKQAERVCLMELEIRLASVHGWSILRTPPKTCQSI